MSKDQQVQTATPSSRLDLLASIFAAIADVPPNERQRMLDRLCPDDDLKAHALELLAVDSSTNLFVDKSPIASKILPKCGESIGPYKLLEVIGQGGMGVVYMAEQLTPVRRKVALKLVKPGVDSIQTLARFDAERQALSVLEHPNVSKVLDAGETEAGRPYFVMELVKGNAINSYCEKNQLSTRERLELFIPVCLAVQHAHQKGIIHRDLKPSNVLVAEYDGRPVPQVIDFGVAKAINQPLTEMTLFTGFGQIVGTFECMSPEQSRFNQLDVDTRTDIYGLGVLLYELLTGCTPFEKRRLRSVEWEEMLRIIREEDPPIPSTRLSDTARDAAPESETRSMECTKISRIVKGELDWIVMKALEKDRERRYPSAQAMAEEIQSYLVGGPVAACPPTFTYRVRKFTHRNRFALATTTLVFAALIVGIIGTTWQAFRASRAEVDALARKEIAERQTARAESSERRALAEAARSNAISRFLRNDLLGLEANSTFLNAQVKFDPDLKLISLLERAREQLDERFEGQPHEKRQMQTLLMESYCSIGRYDIASDLLRPIVEELSARSEPDQAKVIEGIKLLVTFELQQGRWGRARPLLEQLFSHTQTVLGSDHVETQRALNNLATATRMIGDYDAAHERYQQLFDLVRRVDGVESPAALTAKEYLAFVASKLGRDSIAEQWLTEVLSSRRKYSKLADSLDTTLQNLGEFYLAKEQYARAEPLLSEAAQLRKQILEVRSPHTMMTQFCLATAQLGLGQVSEVESVRDAFVDFFQTNLQLTSMATVEQILMHAELQLARGDCSSTTKILELAVAILEFHELDSCEFAHKTRAALDECLTRKVEFESK